MSLLYRTLALRRTLRSIENPTQRRNVWRELCAWFGRDYIEDLDRGVKALEPGF